MAEYRKRVADGILMEKLGATGAVIVEGPKWCGKTTTAERVSKSVIYMAEPKKRERILLYARLEPEKILDGECPRLVDGQARRVRAVRPTGTTGILPVDNTGTTGVPPVDAMGYLTMITKPAV